MPPRPFRQDFQDYLQGGTAGYFWPALPLRFLQRADLAEGYLRDPSSTLESCSFSPRTHHSAEPRKSLDLLPQPPKPLDVWRIEGEDPNLHSHQSNLHFSLICLRSPFC
jgi:hypothetical protein